MRQNIDLRCHVAGRFKLVATDIRTGRTRLLADWFPNLITNGGLDQIGTTATWLSGCSVGSGNTAPTNSDTHLETLVATSTDIVGSTASVLPTTPYYGSRINTYFFPVGGATGVLAEIGIGLSPAALFSRALIKDGSGNPTTVTVTSGEALTAFYEFRNYPPLSDVTGVVTINGVDYAYTMRAANAGASAWETAMLGDIGGPSLTTAFSGGIGAITSQPSGTSAAETSGTDVAYTPASLHVDRNSVYAGPTANFNIASILISCGQSEGSLGQFQLGLSPSLPKDNTHSLALTVRNSWARGPV